MKNPGFLFLMLLLFCTDPLFAQYTVRGKVTDEKGESVVGATIIQKSNPSHGTITDFDGNYSIKIAESSPQVLIYSYISYKTVEITINPSEQQVVVKNVNLISQSQELGEVEVVAKASRERDSYIEKMKMSSAATIDYVSAETIRKTGDSNVGNALARVSGVTSTSSGLVTVRGISDRYVKTTLNNAIIPTLDPFTNNLKLDIFPTTLIDNVIVSKTGQSDFQSDWAGAYISITTKDFPETFFLFLESGIGYNTQSTFKNVVTSRSGSTDWLGMDDGYRDYDHSKYQQVQVVTTQYSELVALGLGDYYSSLGVTVPWDAASAVGETYFKLGLVQLGLLGAAQFNDPVAVAAAKAAYISEGFKNEAFRRINSEASASVKDFKNNWSVIRKSAPLDFSQSLVVGNQVELFGKPLGFIIGGRYSSQHRYDPDGRSFRLDGSNQVRASAFEENGIASHGWSGLLNLNYKFHKNHSLGLIFMPNQTGTNKVRDAIDYTDDPSFAATLFKDQFYEQRKQFVYQFKSENYIPSIKTKIDLNASFTDGNSEAPDFKRLTYFQLETGEYVVDRKEAQVHRYFRYLDDDIFDSQLAIEIPLASKPGLSRKARFGAAYMRNERTSDQYDYRVNWPAGGSPEIANNDLDSFFANETFELLTDSNGNYYFDKNYISDENYANYIFGNKEVISAFAMVDYNLSFAMRITGGLRVEKGTIFTDVVEYDRKGYGVNDPRRRYGDDVFIVNPGEMNETVLLPTIGFIYNITRNVDHPFNIRFNYSKSVARPSIREMLETIIYDYEYRTMVFGNADLKMVKIDNYDFRIERYFKSGANGSVSLFYKDFINHIELIRTNQGITWQNVDRSHVYGVELEGGVQVLNNLDLQANFTYVKSETEFIQKDLVNVDGIKVYYPVDSLKRTMFGQAPYVINAIAGYSFDSLGIAVSASYNLQGRKLVISSVNGNPDVYEMPRHQLDFKISKKLGKYFTVGLKVQNILNEPIRRAYLFDDDRTVDYDNYRYGATYTFTLGYKLSK